MPWVISLTPHASQTVTARRSHIDSASVRVPDSTPTAPDVYLWSSQHPVDVSVEPRRLVSGLPAEG
jgi:hypothetical protein